jgi:hypothetical protein
LRSCAACETVRLPLTAARTTTLLLPLLLVRLPLCCCCRRSRDWDPEQAALSWQAALMFCTLLQQLEQLGYEVRS